MSELAWLLDTYQDYEDQVSETTETEDTWHTMLDHATADGDRFTVLVDTHRAFEPTAYRVNFVERGGRRALGMLVQKAGWYDDSNRRWHREIVFGDNHSLDIDVQRFEVTYFHSGPDGEGTVGDKLFPVPANT